MAPVTRRDGRCSRGVGRPSALLVKRLSCSRVLKMSGFWEPGTRSRPGRGAGASPEFGGSPPACPPVQRSSYGSHGHPADGTPVGLPPDPNSLPKRGVNRVLREPLAGTTEQTLPGTRGHLRAWFSQLSCMNRPGELGVFMAVFRLTSEGSLVRTLLRPPDLCS